jgi:hypothetical protein
MEETKCPIETSKKIPSAQTYIFIVQISMNMVYHILLWETSIFTKESRMIREAIRIELIPNMN